MKNFTTVSAVLLTALAASSVLHAGPIKKKHRKIDKAAENAAIREETIISEKDDHGWQKDPLATDKRNANTGKYAKHTYGRIVRLLKIGALEEADGTTLKNQHAEIMQAAKAVREADGSFTEENNAKMREGLNSLNDAINAAIKAPEQGNNRTPLVNKAQHQFEKRIEAGIKNGRLSTLEASSLRRKLDRLAATEERLKSGSELSSSKRERLMKEVVELRRDINKELRD